MKKAGRLLHITPNGGVGRFEVEPKMGQAIFDRNGKRIGNIIDVFGPVSHPYVRIKGAKGVDLKNFVGKTIYIR